MPPKRSRYSSPRKHVVLRLHKGWSYNPDRRCFFKAGQEPFFPGEDLPKYTRIKFQVPSMARKAKRSEAEDELARGIQIAPPGDEPLAKLLQRIQAWPCVEKAWISPDVYPATRGKKEAKL